MAAMLSVRITHAGWRLGRSSPRQPLRSSSAPGDHVLVIACFRGRGRSSGVRVAERLYEVYTLRNGRIVRVDEFSDRAEALEAVGLRE